MTIKKLGLVALTAVAALSLTGCFKSTAHYTLHEDDTVSGEIIIALHKDFAEEGMTPEDASNSVGGNETIEGIDNVESEPYEDSKFIGVKYTFEDQPLTTIAPSVDGTLVRDGDVFIFQGNEPDTTDLEGMEAFLDEADATLKITFPGKVTDTNGSVSGTTVTWDLLTLTEAPYATGSAIGSGDSGDDSGFSTGVLIAIICGVLVAIVVAVVLANRSKDKDKSAAPAKKAPAKPAAKKPTDKK